MRRFWEFKTYVPFCLLAAGCLLQASCVPDKKQTDMSFGRSTQQRLAEGFQQQIAELSQAEKTLPSAAKAPKMPADYQPWWTEPVCGRIFGDSRAAAYTLENLYVRALQHSAQIRVFSDVPLIRETGIQEAEGEFDCRLFAEAAYEHLNEPVTTLLKTGVGGPNRFKQWETRVEAGVRKKLLTGAEVTLSQELRRTSNNSQYFEPDHQATAVLALTIIQPLLRGAGCEYNRSRIEIAKIDTDIAKQEFVRQAEGHLLAVNRAYWNLYFARAQLLQTQKLVKETGELVAKLDERKDIDTMDSDRQRAKAALSKRRADLVRAEVAVKNAEDRIKALLNDESLLPTPRGELLPANAPFTRPMRIDMKQAAAEALENRPEITQAFLQLKAAAVRKKVAKNELLPQLDLILSSSLFGMDKAGCIHDGFDEQFDDAHPGFLVGMKFEYPCQNNTAKAVYLRRRLEIRQLLADLQTTVDTVLLEVKISAREVMAAYREMSSRYEALMAAEEDVRVLGSRWNSAGGSDKPAAGYLQLLVDAQDRRAAAEAEFAHAAVLYNVAAISLQRAQGTLLKYEDLEIRRSKDDDGLPLLEITRREHTPVTPPPATTKPVVPDRPVMTPAPDNTAKAAPTAPAKPVDTPAVSAAPAATPAPTRAKTEPPAVEAKPDGSPYRKMMVAPAKPSTFAPAKPAQSTPEKRAAAQAVIKKTLDLSALPAPAAKDVTGEALTSK